MRRRGSKAIQAKHLRKGMGTRTAQDCQEDPLQVMPVGSPYWNLLQECAPRLAWPSRMRPLHAGRLGRRGGDDAVLTNPLVHLTTDERGFPRRFGAHVDIGAYELQATGHGRRNGP